MSNWKILLVVLAVVAGGVGLWFYWQHEASYPSTDDAYVQTNIVTVASELTGRVVKVDVSENQQVAAGDVLFELDSAVLTNAVTQAQAQSSAIAQVTQSLADQVQAATAQVSSATTAKQTADDQAARTQKLVQQSYAAQSALDTDNTTAAQAAAALDAAKSQLAAAQAAVATNFDSAAQAKAQLDTANFNLSQSVVKAPVSGWVANITLRPGSVATAYQPLFSIVDSSQWWVDGNFKETDLTRIAAGMPVSVTIDMLPGVTLNGHVGSLGMGSGATFALLPAQNASGNWVKVTQRFPVRIMLDQLDPGLKVGASATATVDTTAKPADTTAKPAGTVQP